MGSPLKLDEQSVESLLDAAAHLAQDQEDEIRRLERALHAVATKNRLLQEEKNNIELRLSLQILKIHDGYLNRITALEEQVERLTERVDGLAARENV
jgi:hypothetical protein